MPKDSEGNNRLPPVPRPQNPWIARYARKVCGKIDLALVLGGNLKKFVQIKDKGDIKTSVESKLALATVND
jgi:hypothetical protein